MADVNLSLFGTGTTLVNIEDEIRDKLAADLTILESGLTLVGTNYYLPNTRGGSRGFVDILARDQHGVFVAIELKKSDHTAREAIHEVLKYTELLQTELNVGADETSAMIVSTHWRELTASYNQILREREVALRGFLLRVNDELEPVAATELHPEPAPPAHEPTPIHVFFDLAYSPNENVDLLWERVVQPLASVGVDDVIGLLLRRERGPSGLYVVLGRMSPDDSRLSALEYLKYDIPDDSLEAPREYINEHRALTHLLEVSRIELPGSELSNPEQLLSSLDLLEWEVEKLYLAGAFWRQRALYSIADVLHRITQGLGQSDVRTQGSARLSHRAAWSRARSNLKKSLIGNPDWETATEAWLDELASASSNAEITYQVYNPCDILTTLTFGWPDRRGQDFRNGFIPSMHIAARSGDVDKLLMGVVVWSGDRVKNLLAQVQAIYRTPFDWHIRAGHSLWETDLAVLESLNLQNACLERNSDGSAYLLLVKDGILQRVAPDLDARTDRPQWSNARPFSQFIYRHLDEVEELVQYLRADMWSYGRDWRE